MKEEEDCMRAAEGCYREGRGKDGGQALSSRGEPEPGRRERGVAEGAGAGRVGGDGGGARRLRGESSRRRREPSRLARRRSAAWLPVERLHMHT